MSLAPSLDFLERGEESLAPCLPRWRSEGGALPSAFLVITTTIATATTDSTTTTTTTIVNVIRREDWNNDRRLL